MKEIKEKQKNKVETLLKKLMSFASLSGEEEGIINFLTQYLKEKGFGVELLPVTGKRANLLATVGQAKIILQAHTDVVPPLIEMTEDETYIYGRGACDTKASVASMVIAAETAKNQGKSDFGLLFTVGEEVDFAGAIAAQKKITEMGAFLVVGEPTGLNPVTGHYGILVLTLVCTGKAAHSSRPELGENAIDKLLGVIDRLKKELKIGTGTLFNLVKMNGGTRDNIIPDQAEMIINLRIAPADKTDYVKLIKKIIGQQAKIKNVQSLEPVWTRLPERLVFLGEGEQVRYCTELSFFKKGIVLGPGDIAVAHAQEEKIKKVELQQAVTLYEKIIFSYLAGEDEVFER